MSFDSVTGLYTLATTAPGNVLNFTVYSSTLAASSLFYTNTFSVGTAANRTLFPCELMGVPDGSSYLVRWLTPLRHEQGRLDCFVNCRPMTWRATSLWPATDPRVRLPSSSSSSS